VLSFIDIWFTKYCIRTKEKDMGLSQIASSDFLAYIRIGHCSYILFNVFREYLQ
jgi:hypothetical protein